MAAKKSAGKRPVAKTKAGGKPPPGPDSFAKRYERVQKSRNAARNDMRPWNGPASSSGATRYVREMDNMYKLDSEFYLASQKKKTAARNAKSDLEDRKKLIKYKGVAKSVKGKK